MKQLRINKILSDYSTSISDLKKEPMHIISSAQSPIAVLNRNQTVCYIVPPAMYEAMIEALDDLELIDIVKKRQNEELVSVSLDDL